MIKMQLLLLPLFIAINGFGQVNPNQENIDAAFEQSFATQQNQLEAVVQELRQDETANAYWIAYAQFYSSIFYLKTNQKDKASESAKDAINVLEAIKKKNSEDHTLLGYVLGFSIAFDPASAPRLAAKAEAQYEAALKKDENNMRTYLGLGESDFRRPVAFGGGKKVEDYLLKAIALPELSMKNGPSWGKNMAYSSLVSYYLRENQSDKAKIYCVQGLAKYPNDFMLNRLKESL